MHETRFCLLLNYQNNKRYTKNSFLIFFYRKILNALTSQLATEPKSTNIQIFYKDATSSIEIVSTINNYFRYYN